MVLQVLWFENMRPQWNEMQSFFWRSICWSFFRGGLGKFWIKNPVAPPEICLLLRLCRTSLRLLQFVVILSLPISYYMIISCRTSTWLVCFCTFCKETGFCLQTYYDNLSTTAQCASAHVTELFNQLNNAVLSLRENVRNLPVPLESPFL